MSEMLTLPGIKSSIALSSTHKSAWVTLQSPAGTLEGKLHLPQTDSAKLVIFQPGFPGGGATDFENWHVESLINSQYAVFVGRHNGTILDGVYSEGYLNCPERLDQARSAGELVLGSNAPYLLTDWLSEPLIALQTLSPSFDKICLIGHSFGGLAVAHALIKLSSAENGSVLDKVDRFIVLAGAVGRLRQAQDPQWTEMLDDSFATDRVRIGSRSDNFSALQGAYHLVHDQARKIPDFIFPVCIHPHSDDAEGMDEVIPTEASLDLIASLDRGLLVLDKTQRANSRPGATVHDMACLKSSQLLEIIELPALPGKTILQIDSSGLH